MGSDESVSSGIAPIANKTIIARIPFWLTTFRILLGAPVLLLAMVGRSGWPMMLCIAVALLSDVYDGIIARKLGIETAALRRYDSVADTIFYLAVFFAIWILFPALIAANALLLAVLFFLELARYIFDFIKFHREASYHMWSAKAWGLLIAAAAVALLGFGQTSLFQAAVILGIICDLEGLVISCILQASATNVKTFVHAVRMRQAATAKTKFAP